MKPKQKLPASDDPASEPKESEKQKLSSESHSNFLIELQKEEIKKTQKSKDETTT